MKYLALLLGITFLSSCTSISKPSVEKIWLGSVLNFNDIQEVMNTYYMYDSTGAKVGSMIFGTTFSNGLIIAKDTSQFDDNSVYETAEFSMDTSSMRLNSLSIQMKTQKAALDILLDQPSSQEIQGTYQIVRDTSVVTHQIDHTYPFEIFREELYMLLQAIQMIPGDTISFRAMVATSMSVSEASLIYMNQEVIQTAYGEKRCDKIALKTDGIMPDNMIWISQDQPRTLVKFYVPAPKLSIELVSQRLPEQ